MATAKRAVRGGVERPTADDYLAKLEHPHKAGVEILRKAILGVDERILHAGSKPRKPARPFRLDDREGLVKGAAKDWEVAGEPISGWASVPSPEDPSRYAWG